MSESSFEVHEALRTLKALYARRADAVFRQPSRASAVALADLFTEDGILDLGPLGRYEGRAALLDAFENILPKGTAWSVHHITNPILEVDGNHAKGSWYFLVFAQTRASPPPPVDTLHGGYEDKYACIAGTWKIAESIAWFTQPAAPASPAV